MSKQQFLSLFKKQNIEMIVIGVSAGGVDALMKLLPAFHGHNNLKVALVIHLPASGDNLIPSLLKSTCEFQISEAKGNEPILPRHIYMAPPNYHLSVEPHGHFSLSSEEAVNFSRPSIDILFDSAAYAYPTKTLGILLTGANEDGALGMLKIKNLGGLTIVQDPSDATYSIMPNAALNLFKPDLVLSLVEITSLISEICSEGVSSEYAR